MFFLVARNPSSGLMRIELHHHLHHSPTTTVIFINSPITVIFINSPSPSSYYVIFLLGDRLQWATCYVKLGQIRLPLSSSVAFSMPIGYCFVLVQINALHMVFYARSEEARLSHSIHKLALAKTSDSNTYHSCDDQVTFLVKVIDCNQGDRHSNDSALNNTDTGPSNSQGFQYRSGLLESRLIQ